MHQEGAGFRASPSSTLQGQPQGGGRTAEFQTLVDVFSKGWMLRAQGCPPMQPYLSRTPQLPLKERETLSLEGNYSLEENVCYSSEFLCL